MGALLAFSSRRDDRFANGRVTSVVRRPAKRFSIRPFQPAHRQALERLWGRVGRNDPPWNAPAVMIENKLKVQPELLLIGEVDQTLVGAVIAGFDGVRGWMTTDRAQRRTAVSDGAGAAGRSGRSTAR